MCSLDVGAPIHAVFTLLSHPTPPAKSRVFMRISAGDPPCYIPVIRWVSPPIYPGIYTPLCIVLLSAIRSSYDLHLPPTMMRLLPCLSYPDCFIYPRLSGASHGLLFTLLCRSFLTRFLSGFLLRFRFYNHPVFTL